MPNQAIEETCADDAASFADQIIASQPMLRAFARSLCRQPELADDLVQEAMMRAWSSRHTFQPGSSLRAWLFTILRNQFYTAIRKRNRHAVWEPEVAERILVQQPEQEAQIHLEDVEGALRQLPTKQREMLLMIAAGGLTYEEAALAADCKIGTVKSRVNRGRAAIRAIIEDGDRMPGV